MWLINTSTLKLEFFGDPENQKYAILSHTWEHEEVSFQDMIDLDKARSKAGFSKIDRTCELARSSGLKYAWVDTCCIDKSSSAELSEAINSMFEWYKLSKICYVYLSDLSEMSNVEADLPNCKWFTRGWTLQELIAPADIEFYNASWELKGSKTDLQEELSGITGIDVDILEDSELLSTACVARRMSWAADRSTTRIEDLAYCLFGLFDVNLPLIYGEGSKAFLRLQEAIVSSVHDLSLFAWTSTGDDQTYRGIFARNPSEFRSCNNFKRDTSPFTPRPKYFVTNRGLQFQSELQVYKGSLFMVLHCTGRRIPGTIAILLVKTSSGGVAQEDDISIPKIILPWESRLLEQRLCHRFYVTIYDSSGLGLEFNKQPSHLWSEGYEKLSGYFITDGHPNFTAAVVIGAPSRNTNITLSSSNQVFKNLYVVLGFTEPTDFTQTPIAPHASIVVPKTNEYNEYLRGVRSIFHRSLITHPSRHDVANFTADSIVNVGGLTRELVPRKQNFRLSVVAMTTESKGPGMYELVMELKEIFD
ncbi:hypothetical protein GLAREA_01204 [Glarea lozoyensis ATCC 20868]|uniref:Uncharacterized protein n=1 Tax=Glarea lozoyensis (strain ATCC 20868 / MF5171) TaxID=1116229 RepID=S3CFP4_GLAL2|nr:uncharacterized protein GLAREA_01204 [Glarea lozoyensis ATCC 20868]EPE25292.1 hypothetical protein GLAREA_01204 [Glarea lozoyensis ATCC 20868]